MAKRKRKHARMRKGSAAAKAWGRKMQRLRAGANPRRKRRHSKRRKNPAYYEWSGQIPVTRSLKGRSRKFLTAAERTAIQELASLYGDSLKKGIDAYLAEPADRRKLMERLHMRDGREHSFAELRQLVHAEAKARRSLKRANSAAAAAEKKAEQIRKLGGEVKYMENPRRRKHRRKKKHAAANPRRRRRRKHKHVAANPRRKHRRHRKHAVANPRRKRRKHRRHSYAGHQHSRLRRGGKFRLRRATISGTVNPLPQMKHMLWLAGGYVMAIGLYKVIDSFGAPAGTAYTGANGLISSSLGALVPAGLPTYISANLPALIAPGLGVAVGLAVKHLPVKALQENKIAQELSEGAIMVGGMFMAVAVASMIKGLFGSFIPANTPVLSAAFSGVSYIPAGGKTDFGMYPQMGDGYRQSAGDFGIIPNGLQGINYTPNRAGMGAVDYYPAGSQGNQMYTQSAEGGAAEAEGLGIIPSGMMGDADFGIMPEMMAGDGQLG